MTGGTILVASERRRLLAELLPGARQLTGPAGPGTVVAVGLGASEGLEELLARGADRVLVGPAGGRGAVAAGVALLERAMASTNPTVALVGSTPLGSEVAARLAQRLGLPLATDATRLERTDAVLHTERRCLGRFLASEAITAVPALVTVRPGVFEGAAADRPEGRPGAIELVPGEAPPPWVRVLSTRPRPSGGAELEGARVIVSVGRGLEGPDDLPLIDALARALGGVVGGSRPVTEHLGWLPLDAKVGLSGKTVRPDLYVACGISGQIEHVVGMRDSRVVVAINRDPDAPIFEEADYGVVADLYRLVPELTAALERRAQVDLDQAREGADVMADATLGRSSMEAP